MVGVLGIGFVLMVMIVRGFGRRLDLAGMVGEQVKAFDVDEQRPIVGRAGRRQNADDGERRRACVRLRR